MRVSLFLSRTSRCGRESVETNGKLVVDALSSRGCEAHSQYFFFGTTTKPERSPFGTKEPEVGDSKNLIDCYGIVLVDSE